MEAAVHLDQLRHQADMAADTLAYRSVPCKKRPLSWYKPPASPVSPSSSSSSSHDEDLSDACPAAAPSPSGLPPPPLSRSPMMLWPGVAAAGVPHPGMLLPTSSACSAVLHAVARSLVSTSYAPLGTPLGTPLRGPTTTATPQPPLVRRQTDFSIEHILRDAGLAKRETTSSAQDRLHLHDDEPADESSGTATQQLDGHFEWLQCTRYRPPKLPRSRRRDGPAQRRLGRNPRIPFSPQQVATLESRFRRSHYLSSADVSELSLQLQLSETRVKIWFQNRRARERRDGDGRSASSPTQPSSAALQPHAKAPAPSLLPRSPVSAFSAPKYQTKMLQEDPSSSPR